jgi:hypothetical protein
MLELFSRVGGPARATALVAYLGTAGIRRTTLARGRVSFPTLR